jgi:hypothetical protein
MATSGSAVPATKMVLQLTHRTFWPSKLSGTARSLVQLGQAKFVGMALHSLAAAHWR